MKIVLTGACGMLGQDLLTELMRKGHEVIAIKFNQEQLGDASSWIDLDVTKQEETYRVITRINPDLVMHCASYNDVDGAERDPKAAFLINAIGTRNVALACQRFDTPLVHFSSDYVFSGDRKTPYDEWESPSPVGQYARSKRWAEQFVTMLLTKFYIVRLSWLFGAGRRNFVDLMLEQAKKNKPIIGVTDMTSVPTSTKDLAGALCKLIELPYYGIYHLTNSGSCSRYEWAQAILRIAGYSKTLIKKGTRTSLHLPAPRPAYSVLAMNHWTLNGLEPLRHWEDALKDYINREVTR